MKSTLPKVWKIIFFIALSFFIFLMALPLLFSKAERKPNERIEKNAIVAYDSLGFKNISIDEKKVILNMLLENKEPFKKHNYVLYSSVKNTIENSVKYPKTLHYEGVDNSYTEKEFYITKSNITNIDYQNGTFNVIINFKSENKISMMVNSVAYFKIKFDSIPQIVEFNIK